MPSRLALSAALAVCCLVWGSTWLVIRTGLEDLPPLTSAAVRFSVAGVAFVGVAALLRRREGGERPARWLVLVVGSLNFAASYGLVYTGETVIPSGLASVLWAVFPVLLAVLGHRWLPEERLGPGGWWGLAVGFAGVALLFRTDLARVGPGAVTMGALYLLSPTVSAVGQIALKRHGARASSLLLNRDAMLVGAALLWLAALVLEREAEARWTPRAVGSVAYLALVGTCLAFGLYHWLLRWLPAGRLALIAYVTPTLALLLGWAVGDEAVGPSTFAGTGLVLAGVALVRRG